MLHVDLDNILTSDELASKAEEVLRKADDEGKIVVITRNGRPAVAVLQLEQLENLSGRTVSTNEPVHELPMNAPQAPETPAAAPIPVPMDTPVATSTPAPSTPQPMAEMPVPAPAAAEPDKSGLPDMPDMP